MRFHGDARRVVNAALTLFSLNTTVVASGAVIESTIAYQERRADPAARIFWYVARTSAEVSAAPSWNFTSSRTFTVTVSLSAESVGRAAATSGTTFVESSGSTRYSRLYSGASRSSAAGDVS